MRFQQLFPPDPEGKGVDATEAYLLPPRHKALPPQLPTAAGQASATPIRRPWVVANMVASVDGAMTIAGRSGGLGSDADHQVFRTLRAMADVVMVGAGTVRAERYGPVRLDETHIADRIARGQDPVPTLAVITNSGRLDPDLPLLDPELVGDGPRPVVLTSATGAEVAVRLGARVEVVVTGDKRVDLGTALAELTARGAGVVTCEGGPTLIDALVADGLLDELCLTTSPLLACGPAGRIISGPLEQVVGIELIHLLESQGSLFARWRLQPGNSG